jgi:hypothetical protein
LSQENFLSEVLCSRVERAFSHNRPPLKGRKTFNARIRKKPNLSPVILRKYQNYHVIKEDTVKFSAALNACAQSSSKAARQFGLNLRTASNWRNMVLKGKRPPPKRLHCLGGGNKPFLRLEIERDFVDKILKLREKGKAVTCDMVRIWALKLAQQPDFHVSNGWLQCFLKRRGLPLHIPTQRKPLKLTVEELKTPDHLNFRHSYAVQKEPSESNGI